MWLHLRFGRPDHEARFGDREGAGKGGRIAGRERGVAERESAASSTAEAAEARRIGESAESCG